MANYIGVTLLYTAVVVWHFSLVVVVVVVVVVVLVVVVVVCLFALLHTFSPSRCLPIRRGASHYYYTPCSKNAHFFYFAVVFTNLGQFS